MALTAVLFTFIPHSISSSGADTCCQKFHVQDGNGNPVAGCNISTGACGSCSGGTTDRDGNVTICGFFVGFNYTATADCVSTPAGIPFTGCTGGVITFVQ